jgi:hypothetical protein
MGDGYWALGKGFSEMREKKMRNGRIQDVRCHSYIGYY